jgi:GNAT superfamily N-acetyltransferase
MTHPAARRRGIAHQLMKVLIDRAAGWGCARLYLT